MESKSGEFHLLFFHGKYTVSMGLLAIGIQTNDACLLINMYVGMCTIIRSLRSQKTSSLLQIAWSLIAGKTTPKQWNKKEIP